MMEQELKDFLVKEGIRSATLQCLIAEDIYSKDHFFSLLPKHFDHLLENKQLGSTCYSRELAKSLLPQVNHCYMEFYCEPLIDACRGHLTPISMSINV